MQPQNGAARFVVLTAVLTAVVLGLGVYLGATLFSPPREAPNASPPQPQETEAPASTAGPTLQGGSDAHAIGVRLRSLEETVADLRTSHSALADRVRPLLEEYERFDREAPGAGKEPTLVGPPDIAGQGSRESVQKLARTLGLNATRREAFGTEFARTLSDLEALEKAHAEVSQEGAVTTIKVGKYSTDGERAVQRWRDWIDRNLTREEKESYERDHSESKLLGLRGGLSDRTVLIDETGGIIQITESIATKDGPQKVLQASAPAQARDLVLEPYAHLLPKAESR